MFKMHREEMDWAGQKLSFETGKIARQAAGAVMVRYGDTCILCTVAISPSPMLYPGFVPLSVHYQEKAFSYGRIPGGFLKRESKPSEQEVLNSRLIDRALRPLFPESFSYETQVLCTVLSYDLEADPAIAAMNGALAAVSLAGIPLRKTAGSVRVGIHQEELIINPNYLILKESPLDLVLSGTSSGILMVESQALQLSETEMLQAIDYGHQEVCQVIQCIEKFVESAQKTMTVVSFDKTSETAEGKALEEKITSFVQDDLKKCAQCLDRTERKKMLYDLKERTFAEFSEEPEGLVSGIFHHLWRSTARQKILSSKTRLDGRRSDEIRPIECEVGVLPRSHGSALFTRGNTQALVAVTLGGKEEGQLVESAMGTWRDSFLLNYNFPPFSVGEVGKVGSPGRREIGHGRLAWRALASVIPQNKTDFPYTLRVVSEITESYGSSSMATVCGSSLALMDAGVPLEAPVAGIAMGLICDSSGAIEILSDISGTEDSLGDMDFKVAGTQKGITALQMDLKIDSLSMEIFEKALKQALVGRHHILNVMQEQTLSESREELSAYAPCVRVLKIPKDRIRDLIGPGGKNIKEICEKTGVKIDVDDHGNVSIFGHTLSASEEAEGRIIMATGSSPEVGKVYEGVVVKLIEVGAFVKFGFADDGFVHISEVTPTRLNNINDALTVGDKVRVQCIGFDQRGRIKLSIKQAAQA
jgi:polyribonucleotide nucleotidyltransferase